MDPPAGHQRAPRASVPAAARRLAFPARVANRASAWPQSGLAVSLLATWVAIWPSARSALVVFAFLYFIWLLGYAAWAFRQGATAAGGVTHWRMQHAALGRPAARDRVRARGAHRARAGHARGGRLRWFRWPRSARRSTITLRSRRRRGFGACGSRPSSTVFLPSARWPAGRHRRTTC